MKLRKRHTRFFYMILLILSANIAVGQDQFTVALNSTHEYRVDRDANLATFEWEVFTNAGLTDIAPATEVVLTQLGAGQEHRISVNWKRLGTYYLKITVTDLNGCTNNLAWRFQVNFVNYAPVAVADGPYFITATGGNSVAGNVLENDTDANGDALSCNITPETAPTLGNVVLNTDGTFTYTYTSTAPIPPTGVTDSFVYQVCDNRTPAACSSGTATILIDKIAPTAPTVNILVTNDVTPTLTGTATLLTDEVLTVTVAGQTYSSAVGTDLTVDPAGVWTLNIPAANAITEGVYDVVATVTDLAGNSASDTTIDELTVDITAPEIPTVIAQLTNNPTPTIEGHANVPVDGVFTVNVDGETYTLNTDTDLTIDGAGNWRLVIPPANSITEGTYEVVAVVTDAASNLATDATHNELRIDTTNPAIPSVIAQVTNTTTPTINGTVTLEPGGNFQVQVNFRTYNLANPALTVIGGNWSLVIPVGEEIPEGNYDVIATVIDAAGNMEADRTADELTIDLTAGVVPTVVAQVTSDNTPIIEGTATVEAGDIFTVEVAGRTYRLNTDVELALAGNRWTLSVGTVLADGIYDVEAQLTDGAGNRAIDETDGELIVDTTLPAAPTVNQLVTNNVSPMISGGVVFPIGGTMQVEVGGITYVYNTDTELTIAGEQWFLNVRNPLAEGFYDVVVIVRDQAGNERRDLTTNEVNVDITIGDPPTVIAQVTTDSTPTISGGVELSVDDQFTVTVNGVVYENITGSPLTVDAATNTWQLTIPDGDLLADGIYDVIATKTDAAGNTVSDLTNNELTIDSTPPTVPTVVAQVTTDTTPIIRGTVSLEVGSRFTVTVDGVAYEYDDTSTDLAVMDNIWMLTIPTPLAEGTYNVDAVIADAAGNVSTDTTNGELVIDTTVPIAPTVIAQTTNDPTPTIRGTVALSINDEFTVSVNGITYMIGIGDALEVDGAGGWSLTIPTANTLDNDVYDVVARITDPAGNDVTDGTNNELTIDLIAPDIPTVVAQTTNDETPRIQGTVDWSFGSVFTIEVNGTTYTFGATAGFEIVGDIWTLDIPTEIPEGLYDVVASITDAAGNVSVDATLNELAIDLTAANVPTVLAQVTTDTTPLLRGTAEIEAGDVFTVTVNAITYDLATSANLIITGTSWELQIETALVDGIYDVDARITDAAGNTVVDGTTGELTIDTMTPTIPTVNALVTNNPTPVISGGVILEVNGSFTVAINGTTFTLGTDTELTVTGDNWFLTIPTALAEGTYDVVATVVDEAGNTSVDTTTDEVIVDLTVGTVPTVTAQITNIETPTIEGTVDYSAGDQFRVEVNGTTYAYGHTTNLVINGDTWRLNTVIPIPEGVYNVVATLTDAAGNSVTDITTGELTIDTTLPERPTVIAQITNDVTPIIEGTVRQEMGGSFTVAVNGVVYNEDTAPELTVVGNMWRLSIQAADALIAGVYDVVTTVTDAAGNSISDNTTDELTIDVIAPAMPTVIAQVTNDQTPTITGGVIYQAGDRFTVTIGGRTFTYGTDTELQIAGTTWTLSITTADAMAEGVYDVVARIRDAAGNSITDNTINELVIDLTGPPVPTVIAQVTNDQTPVIQGTVSLEAGGQFRVVLPVAEKAYTLGTDAALSVSGNIWTLQIPDADRLDEGIYEVEAIVADRAGNTSTDLSSNELTIDLTAGVAPTVVAQVTNDNTPTITGEVTVTGTDIFTVEVNGRIYRLGPDTELSLAGTTWTLQIGTPLADGVYDVTATLIDGVGNSSVDGTNGELTIDTTLPVAPSVNTLITNNARPVISGGVMLEASGVFTVAVAGVTYTEGVDTELTVVDNAWFLSLTTPLAEGVYDVDAVVVDEAGNRVEDPTDGELTIDLTVGTVPTVVAQSTSDRTPLVTGTVVLTAGDSFSVEINGVTYTYGGAEIQLNGSVWRLAIPDANALIDGVYEVEAVVTDVAGNRNVDLTRNELIIDTALPAAPTVVAQTTNDTTPTIEGTVIPELGGGFTVEVNGVVYDITGTELTIVGNTWFLTIPAVHVLDEGTYNVTATVIDNAGNRVADATDNELIIDLTVPQIPTIVSQITADTTPLIRGTVTMGAGDNFRVSVAGVTYVAGVGTDLTILPGNQWELQVPVTLVEGVYDVAAQLVDAAGNIAVDGTTNELTIDLTAPDVPAVDFLVTNDVTPTLTGRADLVNDDTFTVTVSGRTYTWKTDTELTVDLAADTWRLEVAETLAEGLYDIALLIRDVADHETTDITDNELTIDLTVPVAPTVNSLITSDQTPLLSGTVTLEINDRFTVEVAGVVYVYNTDDVLTVDEVLNTWTLAIETPLAEAAYDVVAQVADPAGNISVDGTTNELIIDLTPPEIPTVNRLFTPLTTPIVSGTVNMPGSGRFTVEINGQLYEYGTFAGLVITSTNWTLQIPDEHALVTGTYDVTARVYDEVGHVQADPTNGELVIDTDDTSLVPTVIAQTTDDSTPLVVGNVTLNPDYTFTVEVAGVTYQYPINGALTVTGTTWALQIPVELGQDVYEVVAAMTDAVGNKVTDTTHDELRVQFASPEIPTVNTLATSDNTPTITGTAELETGDSFRVGVNGKVYTYSVSSSPISWDSSTNVWTLTIPDPDALPANIYDVVAVITDEWGNVSSDATTGELEIVDGSTILDLAIAKSSDPRVIIGDTVYYDLRVENAGTRDMANVLVEDDLTTLGVAQVRYRFKDEEPWEDGRAWSGRTIIPTMSAGESRTIQIRAYVVPQVDATVENIAWVNQTSAASENNAANNRSSVRTEFYNGVEAIIMPSRDTVCVDQVTTLDGSHSKGLNLTYNWELLSKPAGAAHVLSDVTQPAISISGDTPGDYVLRLTASNSVMRITDTSEARVHVAEVNSIIEGFHPITLALYYPHVNDTEIYGAEDNEGETTWPRLDGSMSPGVGNTYLWTSNADGIIEGGGETSESIVVGAEGTYYLKVVNRFGCVDNSKVLVGRKHHPIGVSRDTIIAEDGQLRMNVFPNTIEYPGDSLVYDIDGDYNYSAVEITNYVDVANSETAYGNVTYSETTRLLTYVQSKPIGNQERTDEVRLRITDMYDLPTEEFALTIHIRPRPFTIPNAFSPNGDGINDLYVIDGITKDEYAINTFTVFNRFGSKVYEVSNYDNVTNVWDGTPNVGVIGSGALPTGTYFYTLQIPGQPDESGWIYLDR